MKKRFLALLLAVMFIVGATSIPAGAHTYDRAVEIHIQYGLDVENEGFICIMKDNTSACYVNYNTDMDGNAASGPATYEAIIYGSPNGRDGSFVDCTRYSSGGAARTPAIVTKGTEGLVRQDVKEIYGGTAFGQIYGRARSTSDSGRTVTGKWSVDSIDYGYTYYNRIA